MTDGAAPTSPRASGAFAAASSFVRARPLAAFLRFAIIVTILRVFVLIASPAELGVDEIQYWVWSRAVDWGYFSKPPLIAWIIAATTGVFGDAEWAVRFAAPLLHAGSSVFIALTGARLYDARVGAVAGLGWLSLPSVALSSFVISTDAPLLFFWSAALYCFVRLVEAPASRGVAAALGVAVGLGLLAKYAMIYFVAGVVVAAILSPRARAALKPVPAAIAGAIAGLLLAPNIWWNSRHGFQTVVHTAANANWREASFNIAKLGEFLGEQIAIVGPVFAVLLVWGLTTIRKRSGPERRDRDLMLVAFVLPPLVVVAVQAFISRAHANWAATAYPAAI
ncbi:MAG: glycosyltransferase family 39 protein, partial [Parvularculaceae bacterium]|nr:glycosyltransferase family 39 protein [Parvularculaceae bacterium]